jgi:uncharacterized protein (TIGR02996 family)
MLDEPTFLQAIGADPDDDGPRLLFADFLDEKGDSASVAWAEFIRVQCALNSLGQGDPSAAAVRAREKTLLEANWRTWIRPACQALGEPLPTGPVRQPTSKPERYSIRWLDASYRQSHFIEQARSDGGDTPYFYSCQFRRGFIAHVALVAKEYRSARHVARLWERLPIDGLTLANFEAAEIFQILHLIDPSRLRSLELLFTPSQSVEFVASTPSVGPLRELVLRGITDDQNLAEVIRLAPQRLGEIMVIKTPDVPWPWRYYQ